MKTYSKNHEKLTEEEISNIIITLESIYQSMDMQIKIYMEMIEENISKLTQHYFPERFSSSILTMGNLNEMMEKSYGGLSFGSESRRMTRPNSKDEKGEKNEKND